MRSALVFLLMAVSASAQERFVRPVDVSAVSVRRDLAYRNDLKFDLYRPADRTRTPVVIFVNRLSADYRTWPGYIGWAQLCAANGLAAVLYEAREDDALADFDALIAALRSHADDMAIDPSRIAVWSGSTNVLLGLPLAMDQKRDYVRAAVVYYGHAPVTSFRLDVPLMIVRAGLDSHGMLQSIDAMLASAVAANAPWTIENYAAGAHAFDVLNDNDVSRAIIDRTIAFIQSAIRLSKVHESLGDAAAVGAAFNRGDWSAAISGYRRLLTANANDAEAHRRLGLALLETKQFDEALRELETAYTMGRQGVRDTAYPAARAAAGAGNVDRAIHWLEIVMSSRVGPPVQDLRTSDAFATIREAPAFQALLTRFAAK